MGDETASHANPESAKFTTQLVVCQPKTTTNHLSDIYAVLGWLSSRNILISISLLRAA